MADELAEQCQHSEAQMVHTAFGRLTVLSKLPSSIDYPAVDVNLTKELKYHTSMIGRHELVRTLTYKRQLHRSAEASFGRRHAVE
jgi:hypothetical protein